ncbi:helix-turn-helix domain-containing protein [Persicobacter psychrovividus]|uniref:HTH araC/xylS-type domain-containing protein n=1 Tax=Persicobacter psychrovividus TaxID=387638 RepID=A0ABM7VI92_9BACT|nr:hypothetical protein PEPS_29740 [Persicobacter psychrovividus]
MTDALFFWSFMQCAIMGVAIAIVKRTQVNLILSSIFGTMAVNTLLQYLFRFTDLKFQLPELMVFTDVLDLLLPGLVLWYISSLFGEKVTNKQIWYFIPAAAGFVLSGLFILFFGIEFPSFIGSPFHMILLTAIVFWKGIAIYKAHTKLKIMNDQAEAKQKEDLVWPKLLVAFLGITLYVATLQLIYRGAIVPFVGKAVNQYIWNIVQVNYIMFNSSIILLTLFFALKFPKTLSGNTIAIKSEKESSEDNSLMNHYIAKLEKLIAEEKIHLETELNEKVLAERLEIQYYLLSRLLNDHLGKSFSEFINEHRIKHAQNILANDQEKSLTNFAIAVDSGFRSESVFYVNFKKHTGMTPRQYRIKAQKAQFVA